MNAFEDLAQEWVDKNFPPMTEIIKGLPPTCDEFYLRTEREQLVRIVAKALEDWNED